MQGALQSAAAVFPAHLTLWRFQFISWNNIDEKVKLIKFCNCHGDIIPLEQRKAQWKIRLGKNEFTWLYTLQVRNRIRVWLLSQTQYPWPSIQLKKVQSKLPMIRLEGQTSTEKRKTYTLCSTNWRWSSLQQLQLQDVPTIVKLSSSC